jgi:uncharacterized membrane protein YphA (DoxX/SURF4 family)
MKIIEDKFKKIDNYLTNWMATNAIQFLRISLGIIFLWFGVLKFFPGVSSAEELATKTISILSFGFVKPSVSIIVLAIWETLVGLGLIINKFLRETLFLLFLQMIGTITPLLLFPTETFKIFPFVPTLEGQYIIKNIILVSAGIAIGATVRGGKLIANPEKSN